MSLNAFILIFIELAEVADGEEKALGSISLPDVISVK
jgi:hypothetical protein